MPKLPKKLLDAGFWRFARLSLIGLALAVPAGATDLAVYRGNSSYSPLFDWSGNGNTLTMVNTVNTPASPAPYEGDQWLGFHFFENNAYYQIPPSVLVNAKSV